MRWISFGAGRLNPASEWAAPRNAGRKRFTDGHIGYGRVDGWRRRRAERAGRGRPGAGDAGTAGRDGRDPSIVPEERDGRAGAAVGRRADAAGVSGPGGAGTGRD